MKAKQEIRVTCTTKDSLPLEKIIPFQGDLKTLSKTDFEKLKAAIIKYGLSFPSFIWQRNGSAKCLDGHQRSHVLSEMKKEGWKIPPVPVVYVDAKNEKEAKEKILLLSSQYGKYSMDSVYGFMSAGGLDFAELNMLDMPQLDWGKFGDFYFNDNVQAASLDEQGRLDQKSPIECPNCGASFVPNGKRIHSRVANPRNIQFGRLTKRPRGIEGATKIKTTPKYKYLYPLTDEVRKRIEPLRKPYPKRAGSDTVDTSGYPPRKGRVRTDPGAPTSQKRPIIQS